METGNRGAQGPPCSGRGDGTHFPLPKVSESTRTGCIMRNRMKKPVKERKKGRRRGGKKERNKNIKYVESRTLERENR